MVGRQRRSLLVQHTSRRSLPSGLALPSGRSFFAPSMEGGGGPRWVRGRCIGRGSSASVYLAVSAAGEHRSLFAVKSAELSRSASLQREQRILSSLCSPHLVSCFGSDVTAAPQPQGRVVYNLFLEYVPGGSIADAVEREGGLDDRSIRAYTRGILRGLAYLHGRGVVHCDVKGQNVLLSGDRTGVKLADFGCARRVADGEEEPLVVGGTPMYMAPEVARGEEQGPAADIWALGCTVIEMATGRLPWRDVGHPVSAIHRIAFSSDRPELPGDVNGDARDFLRRCLDRDPKRRWSAEELLDHSFVKYCEEFPTDCSPKSVLDQDLWGSWPQLDEEPDGEDEGKSPADNKAAAAAEERLRRLVGCSASPSPGVNATWEDGNWATVRSTTARKATTSSESSGYRDYIPREAEHQTLLRRSLFKQDSDLHIRNISDEADHPCLYKYALPCR